MNSSGEIRAFAPEFRLALACAGWPLSDRKRAEIQQLAIDERINWAKFVQIIERNQFLPIAYRNLCEALPEYRADELRELKTKVVGLARHSLSQAAELVRLSDAAGRAGIELLTLKGIALSVLAFGHVALRSPGDIDLFVDPEKVVEFERVVESLGYERYEPRAKLTPKRRRHYLKYYKHFAYSCEARSILLEVHWRLFHNTRQEPDPKKLAKLSVPVGSSSVLTLPRNELFLYLCVHGAVHGWPILKWLSDISAMLSLMSTDDLREIAALASERGLMPEVHAALMLVDSLLMVDRPRIDLPKPGPVTERIVAMSHRLLLANDHCLDIQDLPRMEMFFYDLRIGPSWHYRGEDILRAFVYPNDWELVDLPDALFPLYAAVRPVSWLVRHVRRMSRRTSAAGQTTPPLST